MTMEEGKAGSSGNAVERAVEQAAERVIELEAELESAGNATTGGDALAVARAALHQWVDSVVGVVAAPGSGRVTLIHANGSRSQIASPELPFRLSPPVRFEPASFGKKK